MKKIINTAMFYMILALIAGVFFRTYTQSIGFTGITKLSVLHTHLFVLGLFFFLIIAALDDKFKIVENKFFKIFYITYNIGLLLTVGMIFARGMVQASGIEVTKYIDYSISGISGIGHIIISIGMAFLFVILKSKKY